VEDMPAEQAERYLINIATDLTVLRADLLHFPITFYFRETEPEGLAGLTRYVATLADGIAKRSDENVRIAGLMVSGALEDFLELIGREFLHMPVTDKEQVMIAFAKGHFRELVKR
jgi:hypothetical protein